MSICRSRSFASVGQGITIRAMLIQASTLVRVEDRENITMRTRTCLSSRLSLQVLRAAAKMPWLKGNEKVRGGAGNE